MTETSTEGGERSPEPNFASVDSPVPSRMELKYVREDQLRGRIGVVLATLGIVLPVVFLAVTVCGAGWIPPYFERLSLQDGWSATDSLKWYYATKASVFAVVLGLSASLLKRAESLLEPLSFRLQLRANDDAKGASTGVAREIADALRQLFSKDS